MKHPRRFIADAMLGKLAKWLRILGLDVAYEKCIEDQKLVRIARLEKRDVLTRDRGLLRRRWSGSVRFIVIESDRIEEQLRQAAMELGLTPKGRFLSRCIRCNAMLRPMEFMRAKHRVPAYIHRTQKRFKQCPDCKRIYWPGSHHRKMIGRIRTILSGDIHHGV